MNIETLKQAIEIAKILDNTDAVKPPTASESYAVVVATTTRDLWYGFATEVGGSMTITNARHIYYYAAHKTKSARGVGSLATHGPASGSKIGPPVASLFIASVAGVMRCSDDAVAAFDGATWSE